MADQELRELKADRDRFVAFAFAAADVLIETTREGIVRFVSGASSRLKDVRAETRQPQLPDYFHPDDAGAIHSCIQGLIARGRMEPVHVRALSRRDRPIQVKLGGCTLETAPDRFFFSLSFTLAMPDTDSELGYVSTATERYREALESGLDPKLSILLLEGLSKIKGAREPAEVHEFLARMRAVVRAYTLGGDAAEVFTEDAIALVHNMDLNDSALDQTVSDLAIKMFDEPLRVQTFTVDMDNQTLSSTDQARALTYAVRQFTRDDDPNRTVISLQESCQSIIGDAIGRVAELRRAIEKQDFTLVFQPIIDTEAKQVHHFEALSRFTSDRPTQELIQMAEQSGLVEDLDLVVLDMVIEGIRQRRRSGWIHTVAANVSARTVESTIYKDAILETLDNAKKYTSQLMLELTETVAIDDFEKLGDHLGALQKAGCRICIDDVGAGTTSFETLISLPADFMKLDGGLLSRAKEQKAARDAMGAIAEMCRSRRIPIIAEHIEDDASLDLVREMGITLGQGFHYGRPMADPENYIFNPDAFERRSAGGKRHKGTGDRETWG
ncbi:MAG: EAL domain-containing protein [Alphaproteobacteria bacterium]|nr:EAL domain-containing protein [Alphaproteobacteria bacterium]